MTVHQQCDITFRLNDMTYQGTMHIEETTSEHGTHYQAFIDSSPLHGTYGGKADSKPLALDFLNLAMQAEGADEIVFSCHSEAA